MDTKKADKDLIEIVKTRLELSELDYSNSKYDELEERLHMMEDTFHENYGATLETALQDVHDEYCPDTNVLLPIAYIAKKYILNEKNIYSPAPNEGVIVEMDDYPGKDTKLVLVPNPLRIILCIENNQQKIVWSATE